jgi:hypothetical protein
LKGPKRSQRVAPLTSWPTPGITTATSSSRAMVTSSGEVASQARSGTIMQKAAASPPTPR